MHPDIFLEFLRRGGQYAEVIHDGVCALRAVLDSIITGYTEMITNLGVVETGAFPIYTLPPPPPKRPYTLAPPPKPDASAKAGDVWADAGAKYKKPDR